MELAMTDQQSPPDPLSPDIPVVTDAHRELLEGVRVVLVEPRHPGNIGAVARAMNVNGLRHLYLVNPAPWRDVDEAWKLAYGSRHVLESAVEVATPDEALADVDTVVGTTHRMGRGRGPMLTPRALGEAVPALLRSGPVAILFGREDFGLPNDALDRCQIGVHIPTACDHPSVNLAQAAMVVAYEVLQGVITEDASSGRAELPDLAAVNALADRIAALAERSGYEHRRGSVGLARSLRKGIRESRATLADAQLAHMLCKHLERYIGRLEKRAAQGDVGETSGDAESEA